MNPVTETKQHAWREALGARIKAERVLRGLEQADVRDEIGLSRATYSRIERGLGVTLDQLVTISQVLGVPLPELVAKAEEDMERRLADPAAGQTRPTKGVIGRTGKGE